jgi:succinate-acetate transporter protein
VLDGGSGFLTVVTPAYFKSSKAMAILVVLVDICLWTIVTLDLGISDPAVWKPVVGYLLIIVGWIGIYMSGAIVCNTVYGKVIYPVPTPFIK